MLAAQTGRLALKFFMLSVLVVSAAAPTRLNNAAVQLPCCRACLNTYRSCLTGCGNDMACKQRCYSTYYTCISSCDLVESSKSTGTENESTNGKENKSTTGKKLKLICPL